VSSYNKTLAFLFRGKELDFQYGTPLNGFSDNGVTKTWSVDSGGAANFTGLKLGASGSGPLPNENLFNCVCRSHGGRRGDLLRSNVCFRGVTTADRVSNVTPPCVLGNISINAYISARDTLLLHFCNPSASIASPPRGIYSVLAVH
jgi:hypothetical protein